MGRRDLHVHTTYSDGADTPAEMALAAISGGFDAIGFSHHSHTSFDESYCIKKERIPAYRAEIAALREKYRNKIDIFCGIEQDYYSDVSAEGFDYAIGSVHYIKAGDGYVPVDEDAETLVRTAEKYFLGDIYALAEEYFRTVSCVAEMPNVKIIGHFDLISKFNEKTPLFDENHPRYAAAWQSAADALLKYGTPFEINTGAIARGYRKTPYPSAAMRRYIEERGGKFIFSSDSHSAQQLLLKFDIG